jgi:diacylglycerol O-acyltransferase
MNLRGTQRAVPATIDRLSAADVINLAVEAADTPMHVGVVAVLEGRGLLDGDGRLRLPDILSAVDGGLGRVPILRKVVYRPGLFAGRPLWVDDPTFSIRRHIDQTSLPPPGGEDQLLQLTTRLLRPNLDRTRPLWRMWFVTGVAGDRVAVIVKLHHAVADGIAAVRLIATLLDPPMLGGRRTVPWRPTPPPSWPTLVHNNVISRTSSVGQLWHRLARPARPARTAGSARSAWHGLSRGWAAPRTSLNGTIGPHRRMAVVRLDLARAKRISHRYGGKVNDVVLTVIAGGLRALLAARGEAVDGVALRAAVAVSLRATSGADETGNRSGVIVVRLPLDQPEPSLRLPVIVAETSIAKQRQFAANEQHAMVFLARAGLLGPVTRRQHLTNVIESNVSGPTDTVRVLGVPVRELIPTGVIAGNLTIAFLAFSYAGQLTITVWCDADRYPDLAVLLDAMNRDWTSLDDADLPRMR